MTQQYALYVDDSGTKEYAPNNTYTHQGPTRHFVFAGLVCSAPTAKALTERVDEMKIETFGTTNVEIKSNWLRRDRERSVRYIERFGVSSEALTRFSESLFDLIEKADAKLIACVVDKLHMREDYKDRAHQPSACAYEFLLQRAQLEMLDVGGTARVIMDDMDGATPAGRQYKANLLTHHRSLRANGSRYVRPAIPMDRIEGELQFRKSQHDNRIQLADLVAYAVYRQFFSHGEAWESVENRNLVMYEYFERIAHKFRQDQNGRVQGFGIVKAPLRRRIPWHYTEEGKRAVTGNPE